MSHARGAGSGLSFSGKELFDLAVAWLALSAAFAILMVGPGADPTTLLTTGFLFLTALSFVTVGVAFLLHELAHKVVAVRFGQQAEFRADYSMLFLAIMSAFLGFLFAAPGAVYHRGRITPRQNGLIALAGPMTNHLLAALFAPLLTLSGTLGQVGQMGLSINLFLAAFNMLPYGPLDGKSVWRWSKLVFVVVFVPSLLLALYALFFVGLW